MKKTLFVLFFTFFSVSSSAVLLDKIVAVVNDKTVTLSEVKRIKENLNARINISPQIYNQRSFTLEELASIQVKGQILRTKLSEMGYVISDEQVEAQVTATEERLGLDRQALLNFLRSNNFSFDEYFELIRSSIEYNLFLSRIVQPLVSITEQDVKNAYYKKHRSNKTLSFKYELVDFSLPQAEFKKGMLRQFRSILTSFQQNGILPSEFSEVSTNVLGEIREGGLTPELKNLLKNTDEGSFSEPILLGSDYHVFFVKKKDLVESDDFLAKQNQIRAQLFQESMESIAKSWFQSEAEKHYIRYFF